MLLSCHKGMMGEEIYESFILKRLNNTDVRTYREYLAPNESKLSQQIVGVGDIFWLNGFQGIESKRLNGLRCVVISPSESPTHWKVHVECGTLSSDSLTVDECNMVPFLPVHVRVPGRHCKEQEDTDERASRAREICDLCLRHKPSHIPIKRNNRLKDEHIQTFHLVCQSYVHALSDTQVNQMTGILALAKLCLEDGEMGAEKVLFALLEGGQCYVDVLIQTIYSTGPMVQRCSKNETRDTYQVEDSSASTLTSDQDSLGYVRFMMAGPLCLLVQMLQYSYSEILLSSIRRSKFYHLLLQRLLRLVAREALFTFDGSELGAMSRLILQKLFPSIRPNLQRKIDRITAQAVLKLSSTLHNNQSVVMNDEAISNLLKEILSHCK